MALTMHSIGHNVRNWPQTQTICFWPSFKIWSIHWKTEVENWCCLCRFSYIIILTLRVKAAGGDQQVYTLKVEVVWVDQIGGGGVSWLYTESICLSTHSNNMLFWWHTLPLQTVPALGWYSFISFDRVEKLRVELLHWIWMLFGWLTSCAQPFPAQQIL